MHVRSYNEDKMIEPKGQLIKGNALEVLEGGSSRTGLLREEDGDIRRDVFMLLNPEDSVAGRPQAGITIVNPRCSTGGHPHGDREEVYFFTQGRGIRGANGEEREVKAGDTSLGPVHSIRRAAPMICL